MPVHQYVVQLVLQALCGSIYSDKTMYNHRKQNSLERETLASVFLLLLLELKGAAGLISFCLFTIFIIMSVDDDN